MIKLKGQWGTRRIWLNNKELLPGKSQKVRNHSPDGFNWGYGGSGPAQLALAICLEFLDEEKAKGIYQDYKWKYIATLPQADFEMELPDPGHPLYDETELMLEEIGEYRSDSF